MITARLVGAAPHRERLAAHPLAAQRARRRVLVHEQARARRCVRGRSSCQSSRSVDGCARRVILLRLRVRANRAALGVEHAHRVGDDVEDRLELRDAAARSSRSSSRSVTSLPAKSSPRPPRRFGERRERGLDEPASAAVLERDARRRDRHAAQRGVDLVGEVGERVGKRVVDRDLRRQSTSTPVSSR